MLNYGRNTAQMRSYISGRVLDLRFKSQLSGIRKCCIEIQFEAQTSMYRDAIHPKQYCFQPSLEEEWFKMKRASMVKASLRQTPKEKEARKDYNKYEVYQKSVDIQKFQTFFIKEIITP